MFFTYFSLVALSFVSFVSAAPSTEAAVAQRDNADVQDIMTTLKSATATVLPQIDSIVVDGDASEKSLGPLFTQVLDAIASTSLESLDVSAKTKRQTDDELASLVASIITEIDTSVTGANAAFPPGFPLVITDFSVALRKLLIDLDILVPDILQDVVLLLDDVVGVVVALLFTLLGGL